MVLKEDDFDGKGLEEWIKETETRHSAQEYNIQLLENTECLDEAKLRSLDSTLKKVTAYIKKVKQIGSSQSITLLLPELEKLNLSKYLDEIATSVCEAKIKVSETMAVVELCVKVASIYATFPDLLLAEFRKHLPFKKDHKVINPSKLRVDLKLLAELVLNNVFKKEGLQLLGSVLNFLVSTDKADHVNVSILMPLCKAVLFDLSELIPLKIKRLVADSKENIRHLSSSLLTSDQKSTITRLFKEYYDSLIQHLNSTRLEMNRIHKSIKKQERTRGDASADDRQKLEQVKQVFDRLLQNAHDLANYIGEDVPPMPEEPSDDEDEIIVKKIKEDDRVSIWPDSDTQTFYESLIDLNRYVTLKAADSVDQICETDTTTQDEMENSVVNEIGDVDMSELISEQQSQLYENSEETADDEESDVDEESETTWQDTPELRNETEVSKEQINMTQFLDRLSNAINREFIDKCAVDFVTELNRKGNRKRLIQQILNLPSNRLDLLPFMARFMATIKPIVPEVSHKVVNELLNKFRSIATKKYVPPKKGEKRADQIRIDAKIHLASFIAELVKFSVIPKAEALACLRSLLVDLKSFKVDMLCVMIESMGIFLYRTESHAKMSVILEVLKDKNQKFIKDERQKILLDNAYFSVIPPEDISAPLERRPPMEEFIQMKICTTPGRASILRRIDWSDKHISEYTLKILSNPTSVRFSDIEKLASLVGLLSDYHDWIGVHVVDDVLEFIRLALETSNPEFHQRLFSSIAYVGELYNYNLCSSGIIFKVLYQLITFAITDSDKLDELGRRMIRIRLVSDLINTVGEFFLGGSYKKKMDTFLHFFLRFFYNTKSKWGPEATEELGEFPQDTSYTIEEILKKWRKNEKFAKNLEEAQQRVNDIEKEYKTKVEEALQGITKHNHDDDDADNQRRLNCIMEDEEDETEEEHRERHNTGSLEESSQPTNFEGLPESDEEQIRVHKERNVLPEDEEFMRDFDRMMNEAVQMAPVNLKTPLSDLEVPPAARQKFERKLCFEDGTTKPSTSEEFSLRQPIQVKKQSPAKIALMTRDRKKGTILKAVNVETSESMEETWRRTKESRERERREIKNLTLGLDERMRLVEEQEEPDLGNMPNWPKLGNNHE